MSLESALLAFELSLDRLRRALEGVRSACDDHPEPGDAVFVDLYGDAADDLAGRLHRTLSAVRTLHRQGGGGDLGGAGRTLERASQELATVRERLYFDLVYPRLGELAHFGTERGGEWLGWGQAVRDAVERCLVPLAAAERARDLAWREVGERAAGGQLLVRMTGRSAPAEEESPV